VLGYVVHPGVALDLDAIWEYIALDSLDAADRFVAELRTEFEALASLPAIGHRRSDLTDRQVRFWPVRDYLVVYAPGSNPMRILTVVHGQRSPHFISALLRSRT
jgi:plasmid stabilization system protein ParE